LSRKIWQILRVTHLHLSETCSQFGRSECSQACLYAEVQQVHPKSVVSSAQVCQGPKGGRSAWGIPGGCWPRWLEEVNEDTGVVTHLAREPMIFSGVSSRGSLYVSCYVLVTLARERAPVEGWLQLHSWASLWERGVLCVTMLCSKAPEIKKQKQVLEQARRCCVPPASNWNRNSVEGGRVEAAAQPML